MWPGKRLSPRTRRRLRRLAAEGVYWLARLVSARVVRGVVLALFVMAVPYVAAKRDLAPFKVKDPLDVLSHLGNTFYAAPVSAARLPVSLVTGNWAAARTHAAGMLGVRTRLYDTLGNYDALNRAEWLAMNGITLLLGLTLIRLGCLTYDQRYWRRRRQRRARTAPGRFIRRFYLRHIRQRNPDPVCRGLNSLSDCCGVAFLTVFLLANTTRYFRDLTGPLNWIETLGNGLVAILDRGIGLAWALKEAVWHAFYLIGSGKEQGIGWLTRRPAIEDLAHYLDDYPLEALPEVYASALYFAALAWLGARAAYFSKGVVWRALKRTRRHLGQRLRN
ncbi:MAG: hypothetical protein ACFE0O_10030 [Opitutales bacterium]